MNRFINVIVISTLASLMSACASKPLEPRNITTYDEPYQLEWVEVDYSPAENASLAMAKMQKLGIDFAINDALNADDTYTHYSRGSRAGSALISAAGMGLMSGVADLSNTGRANERTSEYSPHAGFYIDAAEFEGLTPEEQFQKAIRVVGHSMFDALARELDDAQLIGIFNSALVENTGILAVNSSYCSEERRQRMGYRTSISRPIVFQDHDEELTIECFISYRVSGVDLGDEKLIRAELRTGEFVYAPIMRNLDNAFVVMPFRYRAGSRRVTVQNNVPYVAWEGKANLFTRDSATIEIL